MSVYPYTLPGARFAQYGYHKCHFPRAGLWARAMFRTAVMMAASLALTGAVVAHAYYLKHQFYPTVVYLTKSSPSMAVSSGLREGGMPREGRRSLLGAEMGLHVIEVGEK